MFLDLKCKISPDSQTFTQRRLCRLPLFPGMSMCADSSTDTNKMQGDPLKIGTLARSKTFSKQYPTYFRTKKVLFRCLLLVMVFPLTQETWDLFYFFFSRLFYLCDPFSKISFGTLVFKFINYLVGIKLYWVSLLVTYPQGPFMPWSVLIFEEFCSFTFFYLNSFGLGLY